MLVLLFISFVTKGNVNVAPALDSYQSSAFLKGFTEGYNNYKQTYLKTIHNQLSALFNYAVRFYGLNNNPARLAGNMGVGEMKFWTKEEYLTFSRSMMNKEESYHAFEILY